MEVKDVLKGKSDEDILMAMKNKNPKNLKQLLVQSIEKGFLPGVKKILKMGINVHVENDFALRYASYCGHYNIVEFLIKIGADIHADNDYALRWASANGHYDVVELLKKWIVKKINK